MVGQSDFVAPGDGCPQSSSLMTFSACRRQASYTINCKERQQDQDACAALYDSAYDEPYGTERMVAGMKSALGKYASWTLRFICSEHHFGHCSTTFEKQASLAFVLEYWQNLLMTCWTHKILISRPYGEEGTLGDYLQHREHVQDDRAYIEAIDGLDMQ